MGKYNKAVVAVVGAGLALFFDTFGAGLGLPSDWVANTMMVITPILVYVVPNDPAPPVA